MIVKISEGSVRDALSLLDRALLTLNEDRELDLVSAQKIYLLLKTAEAELATSSGAGSLVSVKAVIANAEKKYNKAVEMCGGHCGCNC